MEIASGELNIEVLEQGQGPPGEKGEGIASVERFYLLRAGGLPNPAIDDLKIKPPSTDGITWSETEPSYTEERPDVLYFTDCMTLTDGSISYSKVSISSSYEAAKLAYDMADSADSKIDAVTDNIYVDNTEEIDGKKIFGNSLSIEQMDETVAGTYSDTETRRGSMKWENDALHIKSMDQAEQNVYETVIGGDGIKFNWNNVETASIDQDELRINKTVVINAMEVGNWSWAIHPVTGNLMVKWNGGD